MKKNINPFIIKGYYSKNFFCNRNHELKILQTNFENGVNTTLISPRKIGKSGLIFRFYDELVSRKEIECIYVDIYSSNSLSDFIRHMAEAILRKFPQRTKIGAGFFKHIQRLRPVITFDPLTGNPQIQIAYQTDSEKEFTLFGLLEFLEKQEKSIVLAIDEFQQISTYPEKNIESLLRTYIQSIKNIHFIFCGSNEHLMTEMFSSSKRPFFASTRLLFLEKLDASEYGEFIKHHFEKSNKRIAEEAIHFILDWTKRHTFYTQNVCNAVFSKGEEHISLEDVKKVISEILKENEPFYFQYRQFLTDSQWNFLIALAKEEEVIQITAQKFINTYSIGTPANSKRILQSLLDKELILRIQNENTTIFQIYDIYFMRWLQRTF